MITVSIKPMSINDAFQGRRFRTPEYKAYEKAVMYMLPKIKLPDPPFNLILRFGFSSKLADASNPIKLFEDILQKKYKFNDNVVYHLDVTKEIVKKGQEFIQFEITHYNK